MAPQCCRLTSTCSAPRGGQQGRCRESLFAPPPPSPAALLSLPSSASPPSSPDPPPSSLRHRDGRGLPLPPPAAPRGPLSCRACGAACLGPDVRWLSPVEGTSRFPVTRSPQRKRRDEAQLFLCRLPGSTCAACGFLGTRGPRPGLALPAASLVQDWSALGLQAR